MDVSGDELAGVVDLFGGLTRAELERALEELAFKRGEDVAGEAFTGDVEQAVAAYHLVAVDGERLDATLDGDADAVLVDGPVAFPTLPDGATDLPHIMDVPERSVDRDTAGAAARERLAEDADDAIESGDSDRIDELVDVSYDLETWASVDVADVRDRLVDANE